MPARLLDTTEYGRYIYACLCQRRRGFDPLPILCIRGLYYTVPKQIIEYLSR